MCPTETKLGCAGSCGCCDGAAAPSDTGKQPGIGEAHAEEVVAPIVASSHYHPPLVAGEESRGCGDKDFGWECRGIGAQHASSGVACREQLLDCMKKAATKPFHAPRGWCGAVRQNAGGSQRQMRGEGFLCAGRSIGGIADEWSAQRGRGNALGGVPQKCGA